MKRKACWAVFLTFVMLVTSFHPGALAATPSQINTAAGKAVAYLHSRYESGKEAAIDDWSLIGLVLSGEALPSAKWGDRSKWQAELKRRLQTLDPRKTTDYARFVLTVLALGEDPANVGGENMIARLKKAQLANGKFADRIDGQGQSLINAHVWSLIALYAAGEQIPRAKQAKAWLVSKQLPDGGYQFATDGRTGGIDMTAMTLVAFKALGMGKEEQPVKKALDFLRKAQTANGGYQEGGIPNAESAATVISALLAWGEQPENWKKGAGSVTDNLLGFQTAAGAFAHTRGGSANQIATAQALLALSDLKRGGAYLTFLREKSGARKVARLADLPPSYWAYAEMAYLVKNGYMQGMTSTLMQPESRVTRAQFAALLLRILGEEPNTRAQGLFRDVSATDWTAPIVEKAAALGLMQGSGGRFRPHEGITQEEMATIVSRVLKRYGWNKTFPGPGVSVNGKTVSPWAKASVEDLQRRRLLGGTATKQFTAKAAVTRAEAAVMFYRMLHVR
ncbi:hypothetical protein G3578_13905 [Brevibacillus sp. SYP-B805]|uniref:S-layer homology domain-containing protein n=1 Tax=Brevibacillus sp. SYP-B805 TaxID=1578199 RepID=UPI0013EB76EF|nr:S-layer homology domain-containing protein [Brevibacillus sp. SYP-B805]NGQ96256.1 hypothetical protein [Brevibacillus sp. SYP-B805]